MTLSFHGSDCDSHQRPSLKRKGSYELLTFIFPMIFAVLFGMIFGGGGESGGKSGVPIAVLNEDGGRSATEFVQDLGKDDSLRDECCGPQAEGEAMARKGDASACVVVPKGYSGSGLFSGTAS